MITKGDLYGVWALDEHVIDGTSFGEYVQIHKAVDITTNATLWTDTVAFGKTQLHLLPCGNPCIVMNANIHSTKVRVLNGSWQLDKALLSLQSLVTPEMAGDTIINTHKYSFYDLVNNLNFTVVSVDQSHLELATGGQELHFTRVN